MDNEEANFILRHNILAEINNKMESAARLFDLLRETDDKMVTTEMYNYYGKVAIELKWMENGQG